MKVSKNLTVSQMVQAAQQDYEDQLCAQIAVTSCDVARTTIKQGVMNHILYVRKKPKTKYEYNQERVRDFRIGKTQEVVNVAITEQVADDLEQYGKASYFLLQNDPVPFVRDYKYGIFGDTMKLMHPSHKHFNAIWKIDISQQLIGDERFRSMADCLKRSSIRILNISGNKLSNISMEVLSKVQRSMHLLEGLNISKNRITDAGIDALFREDKYSSSLRTLDATFNNLGSKSAYYIGMMFREERKSCLEHLALGGRIGRKGWGDEFVKVLLAAIMECELGIARLKSLSIGDAGLSDSSMDAVGTLLVCDSVGLRELNISRCAVQHDTTKANFINALVVNKSLERLFIRECGFNELNWRNAHLALRNPCSTFFPPAVRQASMSVPPDDSLMLTTAADGKQLNLNRRDGGLHWPEQIRLAYCAALNLNACRHRHHGVKISFIKDNPWRVPKPPLWQSVSEVFGSDLLSNVESTFHSRQVIFPQYVKNELSLLNDILLYSERLKEALILCRALAVGSAPHQQQQFCNLPPIHTHRHQVTGISSNSDISEDPFGFAAVCAVVQIYENLADAAKRCLFSSLEAFLIESEEVLKIAKRKERKNIKVLVVEVSMRVNTDSVMLSIEDYRAAAMELCHSTERAIGTFHRSKILHYSKLQASSSGVANTRSTLSSSIETPKDLAVMRKMLPYFHQLGVAACFIHYFYFQFALDRNDNKKVEEKMLQQLLVQVEVTQQNHPGVQVQVNSQDAREEGNAKFVENSDTSTSVIPNSRRGNIFIPKGLGPGGTGKGMRMESNDPPAESTVKLPSLL